MNTKISVALATYNGEKYLSEQLDSILAQTIMPDEIICFDDGSTDGTLSILQEYRKKYPSVIHLFLRKADEAKGSTNNFIRAIKKTTGDIIFISDQDDLWDYNRIETMSQQFESNIDVIISDEYVWDGNAKVLSPSEVYPPNEAIFYNSTLGHSCAIHKRIKYIFEFDGHVAYDQRICIFCSITKRFLCLHKPLMKWRRHGGAVTMASSNNKKVRSVSKVHSVFIVFLRLFNNYTSSAVCDFEDRSQFLAFLMRYTHCCKYTKCLSKLCKRMREQTPISLMIAAILNSYLMIRMEKKTNIRSFLSALYAPFRYYIQVSDCEFCYIL